MLGHGLFDWTSWFFSCAAAIYIVISEWRVMRERRRVRRIAGELEPSTPHAEGPAAGAAHQVRAGTDMPPATRARFDDQLRSLLIQAAVDSLPLSIAVQRARRFGAQRADVEAAAKRLRDSHLLRFSEPLEDDTKIRLS
jgi:hypothetical protein